MSASDGDGTRFAKLAQRADPEHRGEVPESRNADQQATYEIASAMRHLATAVQHLNDHTTHSSSLRGNGTDSQIGDHRHTNVEPANGKRNQRSLLGWRLLIGGARVDAVIELGRALLDKIPH